TRPTANTARRSRAVWAAQNGCERVGLACCHALRQVLVRRTLAPPTRAAKPPRPACLPASRVWRALIRRTDHVNLVLAAPTPGNGAERLRPHGKAAAQMTEKTGK